MTGDAGWPGAEAPLVLVVEDFDDGREILAEHLTVHGYRVETASDGAEALDKATALVPDVILMDLSLPLIDGWEVTRRLRQDDRTRHVRIIALTAHVLDREKRRAVDAGCNEVVTKPVIPRELEREVARQVTIAAEQRRAATRRSS